MSSNNEGADHDDNAADAWDASLSAAEEAWDDPEDSSSVLEDDAGAPMHEPPAPVRQVPAMPLEARQARAAPSETAAVPTAKASEPDLSDGDRPMSLAETWLAGQEKPKFPTRLVVAASIFVGIFSAAALIGHTLSNLKLPDFAPRSLESLLAKPEVSRRDEWLKDVLAGKAEEQQWDLLPMVGGHAPGASGAKASIGAGGGGAKAHKVAKAVPAAKTTTPPAVVETADDTDPFFAEYFGSAERYKAGSKHPSSRQGAAVGGRQHGTDVRGQVLGARLKDEVSSDIVGAPVIAVLTRQAKVGGHTWPKGTEIHGEVASSSDTRIFVNFGFVRTSDETITNLTGKARDGGGRSGIPGKKLFNKQSAGSIGVSSATKMMQQLGRELAGSAGSVLGAGVAGAGDSAAEKAQRADRDEYVVVVASGTTFSIYIEGIGSDENS